MGKSNRRIVWVTHHAVKRFRQRVERLPSVNEIRRRLTDAINAGIEVAPSAGYLATMCRKHLKPGTRYFRASLDSQQYIIVICEGDITPWAVVTIRPDSPHFFNLAGGKRYGQRLDY